MEDIQEKIKNLQDQIGCAYKEGKDIKIKRLQWKLVKNEEIQKEAIRQLSLNKGSKTPGVDGITWETDGDKEKALKTLKDNLSKGYTAKPVKRVMIDKPGKSEKRPLGIPTMDDRLMQKIWSMALLPISEITADEHSYGSRPGKSTQDAIKALKKPLNGKATWVLEGDIKGFFDNIDKTWILNNIPMDKTILSQWLNMGFFFQNKLYDTENGVPQGGVISPMIANMVLDGLQKRVKDTFSSEYIVVVRYMDDFVVTGASEKQLAYVKFKINDFMVKRGLSLHPTKTLITKAKDGFDFLGFNLKMGPSKTEQWENTLFVRVSPKSSSQKKLLTNIRNVDVNGQMTVLAYIERCNSIIRGWANYYIICDDKWPIYKILGGEIWQITHRWLMMKYPKSNLKELWRVHYTRSGPKSGTTMFALNEKGKKIEMIPILKLWNQSKK